MILDLKDRLGAGGEPVGDRLAGRGARGAAGARPLAGRRRATPSSRSARTTTGPSRSCSARPSRGWADEPDGTAEDSDDLRVVADTVAEDEVAIRRGAPAPVAGGVRRAGPHQGAARAADRRRPRPRRARSTTSCCPGPPGLGKTTLAGIVANEIGVGFRPTSGPALERAGDLAAILTNLEEGDVLFVDEVHRMPRTVEEVLYPALEDFKLDVVIGKGPSARSIRLDLPRFTLVAATTRPGADHAAAAGAVRLLAAPRLLLGRGPGAGGDALGRHPGGPGRAGRRRRDRRPLAGHAPHRQPPAAPGPRLRRGPRRRPGHARVRGRRARAVRGRRARAGQARPGDPHHDRREVPRRAGRACPRSRRRWARSPTRSRTCTSRT